MVREKMKEAYYRFNGCPDERITAESNRIYKIGFVMLSVGFIVDLYYQTALAQVKWMVEGAPFTLGFDPLLYGWFLATMVFCSVVMSRKGFVATGRFAETEEFPMGYFAAVSACAGLATGILGMLVRVLAEFQVAGPEGVLWLVDGFIGRVCLFSCSRCAMWRFLPASLPPSAPGKRPRTGGKTDHRSCVAVRC